MILPILQVIFQKAQALYQLCCSLLSATLVYDGSAIDSFIYQFMLNLCCTDSEFQFAGSFIYQLMLNLCYIDSEFQFAVFMSSYSSFGISRGRVGPSALQSQLSQGSFVAI